MANRFSRGLGTCPPSRLRRFGRARRSSMDRGRAEAGGLRLRGRAPVGSGTHSPRSSQSKIPHVAVFAAFAAFAFLVATAGAQPTERARTEALARRATDRLQAL